jgi:hypothetical protein
MVVMDAPHPSQQKAKREQQTAHHAETRIPTVHAHAAARSVVVLFCFLLSRSGLQRSSSCSTYAHAVTCILRLQQC